MFIRKNTRLKGYNYNQPNLYFITICEKHRRNLFSNIITNDNRSVEAYETSPVRINLTPIGIMIEQIINDLENIFAGVKIHEYVVMPNHVHFILELTKEKLVYKLSNKSATFKQIIGTLKSKSKTFCTKQNLDFEWQQNYYEDIIRTEKDLIFIQNYINNNPLSWDFDSLNPDKVNL
jgi:putative transposase